jgi:hypothetical protein
MKQVASMAEGSSSTIAPTSTMSTELSSSLSPTGRDRNVEQGNTQTAIVTSPPALTSTPPELGKQDHPTGLSATVRLPSE